MDAPLYWAQKFVGFSVGFSLLGFIEVTSVAFIVYFVLAKTRAPEIISRLFPTLNMNYRSPVLRLNSAGNELLLAFYHYNKESKPEANLEHGVNTQNMLEITPHAGRKPYNTFFDWAVYFPFLAQNIRFKKYHYPQVSELVEKDPTLQRAIKQATEEILKEEKSNKENHNHRIEPVDTIDHENISYQRILRQQEKRAYTILMDMRSTINNFLIALTSWLLYKLLPCFLSGVVTHTKQIEMLKTASERANGIPLIFLPVHRSHLDYIMVTFILANNDIKSPLVAAGNNLQIPIFGGLLRGLGAFFIKRKIDPVVGKKDIIYRAVLHLYLQHALKMGHNVEFFIEGGRTRTGKPCMPKSGILSVIVNAFMDRSIQDALLVPVSVNYERLVDGNFVREQMGQKKIPETFWKAMSGIWKTLNSKYGLMRIDFNEPFSIRELVQTYNKIAREDGSMKIYKPGVRPLQHNQSTSSLYGTDVVCEEHRTLIDSISRQVVYDCAVATSVMSTNAIAFLLLTRFRNGGSEVEVVEALDALRGILIGKRDMGFSGESLHIVKYACDLLGPDLITQIRNERQQVLIQPKGSIESLIELAYYSNTLTPHFALESIVLTTFHSLLNVESKNEIEKNADEEAGVSRKRLIEVACENCDVFRYEFILNKPTQSLDNLLEITVDNLTIRGLIRPLETAYEAESIMESRKISRRVATFLGENDEDYEDYVDMDELEKPEFFLAKETFAEQKALCEVLAPFSFTYLAVAQSLKILYKNSILETEYIKFVIKDITNKFASGLCPYGESVSTDSVRNCLKLLEKWSVIEVCNANGLRLISLGSMYDSSPDGINGIIQRISSVVPKIKLTF